MKTQDDIKAYKRKWYQENRARILESRKKRWEEKREELAEYQRKHRLENVEEYKAKSRKWKADNAERHRASSREYSRAHADEISEKRKKERRTLKQSVIDAYGGKCACCGINTHEFLTIDHVNGDGAAHRKENGISSGRSFKLYRLLTNQGFPPGFRVLCFNCNSSRGFYGYCPHHPEDKTGVPPTRQSKAKPAR